MTGSLQLVRSNALDGSTTILPDDSPIRIQPGEYPSGTAPEDDNVLQYLLAYANQAKQEIARQAARIQFLETLSQTDELTGILNRRGFLNALDQALSASARYGEQGLIAYIDLDDFKNVNDEFGHEKGDEVLCRIAETLRNNIRATDAAGRLGGDEFAVLLTRSADLAARAHLESIHQKINETKFRAKHAPFSVSASFGIQSYGPNSRASDLLRNADRSMYDRKRQKSRTK